MRRVLFILLVTAAICTIAAIISDNFLIGLAAVLFLPVFFLFELCFYIMPISLVVLAVLSIWQFIIKDYKKFNSIFEYLIICSALGIVNAKTESIMAATTYLLPEDLTKIYVYIFALIVTGIGSVYIASKKDSRLYLPFVIFMIGYLISYYLKGL